MARKKYLPQFSRLPYTVGVSCLEARPELAALVGQSIAACSYVDNAMGNLLGVLLGSNSEATIEVFLTLRRFSNQNEALNLAAEIGLRTDEMTLFNALMRTYSAIEKERNALAHGCFGNCDSDETILFWIEMRHHVRFQTRVLSKVASGDNFDQDHSILKEHLFVYTRKDLEQIYSDILIFVKNIGEFMSMLRFQVAGKDETIQKMLLRPEIASQIT